MALQSGDKYLLPGHGWKEVIARTLKHPSGGLPEGGKLVDEKKQSNRFRQKRDKSRTNGVTQISEWNRSRERFWKGESI